MPLYHANIMLLVHKSQALIWFSILSALIGLRKTNSRKPTKTYNTLSKSTNPLSSVRDLVPTFPVSIGFIEQEV